MIVSFCELDDFLAPRPAHMRVGPKTAKSITRINIIQKQAERADHPTFLKLASLVRGEQQNAKVSSIHEGRLRSCPLSSLQSAIRNAREVNKTQDAPLLARYSLLLMYPGLLIRKGHFLSRLA
jgi:hypothetical protein